MARDKYHELVKQALIDEGWTITDDPFQVSSLIADLEVDLAAERIIAAEKGTEHIAIEIKSFLGKSWLHDFYKSVASRIISELSFKKNKSGRPIRYQAIMDNESGNYLLVRNGWKGTTRFYNILVHIEVTDQGTVWLHQDNTDLIIADMLLEADIPQHKIVLAFHAPAARPDTAFAVG